MIEIEINPESSLNGLEQLQKHIGGKIENVTNQYILTIDNEIAKGSITYNSFDWGVHLTDFKIRFYKELILRTSAERYNPLRFMYTMQGYFTHRFGVNNDEHEVEQFHSVIYTNKDGGANYLHFPKGINIHINIIQVIRQDFLKKSTTNVSTLNQRLHEVFVDKDYENRFAHYGSLNLKISDYIKAIKKVKGKGMVKAMQIEALVYEILAFHIQQHNKFFKGVPLPTSLSSRELKLIRKLGNSIIKDPSFNYSLDELSASAGLSQAKLQEGFKFLYSKTVTEYVRHIRLERARDLLNQADLNISQVVYSIGFTSRSYFSKIFKEKYKITPNEYRKNTLRNMVVEDVEA